ncbi:MAG TPA: O-antigen ligase family protein [Thermomicrobiales bacterium]|jgi:putative inorganic carbon (HCO3(-)) transporter|nr:O-antigen ligase family protein [Thermomicrobiales bacterium]
MTIRRFPPVFGRPDIACILAILISAPVAFGIPTVVKLGLLLLATGVVVLGGPVAGVSLVCAALSVSAFVFTIGSTEWSPLELALLSCGAATGFVVVLEFARNRRLSVIWKWIGPRDVIFIAVAVLVVGALSILWVADADLRSDSLRSLRRVIIEPLLVIPAMTAVVRARQQAVVARWIAGPAVLVAVLALAQLAAQRSTVDIGGIARPIGTFTHPNNLSFYLERAIWFSPFLAVPFARRGDRWSWAAGGVILLATIATLSRGAAIALAAGGLVMFWEVIRARWRLFAGLATAGVAAIFASRYLAETGDSIDTRTTIWRSSVDMLRDHPVTGVGLDQFLGQYGRRYVRIEGWPERYTSHPHNLFLDFWLSLGLAGLATLWMILEATWSRIRSTLGTSGPTVHRAGVALLVAGFAHGLIDNSFFLPYLATMTWIGLTISVLPGRDHG